ncbi:DUF3085 domain-containing protein [Salmonella enterica]|nr:DUF3085 domain-containing protein [Salmonella enterica]EHE3167752.1 DUF3085 domain-containing protein [Salmonella enterica]EHM5264120.1 DUF3085 domain-containing protein [Salmonella enterica]EIR0277832.1 DUF3085 domain-containing protein [Salmonella enterica]
MFTLTFEMSGVKKLLEELRSAERFNATIEQLFDPANYPGGTPLNEAGKTEVEINQTGGIFWPSSKHIDTTRLTPQILLVKDHGVYLVTNASLEGTSASRDTVAYARGLNPSVDDEWYDEAEEAMGGDDSSVSVPLAWFELAIEKKFKAFCLKVSPTKITMVNG